MTAGRAAWVAGASALAALAVTPAHGTAQVAEALAGMDDGVVAFSYATRPGTRFCGESGHTVSVGRGVRMERGPRGDAERCREGSALVEVTLEGGTVTEVAFLGAGELPRAEARDLGRVSAPESARAFLDMARDDGPEADDALVAAVVADSMVIWPDLLDIARDRDRVRRTRKNALFWLGQEAAARVTDALAETADDGTEAREIREAAVFALSQRPDEESLPALMRLAREGAHPDTRRSALFWLAQSDDPAVPDFFAEILGVG